MQDSSGYQAAQYLQELNQTLNDRDFVYVVGKAITGHTLPCFTMHMCLLEAHYKICQSDSLSITKDSDIVCSLLQQNSDHLRKNNGLYGFLDFYFRNRKAVQGYLNEQDYGLIESVVDLCAESKSRDPYASAGKKTFHIIASHFPDDAIDLSSLFLEHPAFQNSPSFLGFIEKENDFYAMKMTLCEESIDPDTHYEELKKLPWGNCMSRLEITD